MGELLDKKTKIWAKENLKKDVLFLLKVKLESEELKYGKWGQVQFSFVM